MKKIDFDNDSIKKNILQAALPMLAAQILSLLYNIVDRIYIARIPDMGTTALGAVGLCFPIIMLTIAFSNLFGSGGAPLFSIKRGMSDDRAANTIMNTSFTMVCTFAVVFTALCMIFAKPILIVFGASENALKYALPYLLIYLIGTLPSMISTGMNPFINAQGYSTTGMLSVAIGAVVPESGGEYRIRFSLRKNEAEIMLDTSGEGLHKRGYRRQSTLAPIKETLACAMLDLGRIYPDSTVQDPFCGSGTLCIEAAMKALHIAPGLHRRFAAERYAFVPAGTFQRARADALEQVVRDAPFEAVGFDIDGDAVALAAHNAKLAGVASHVRFYRADVKDFAPRAGSLVFTNPPYGERLGDAGTAAALERTLGQRLAACSVKGAYIITADADFEAHFGRKAQRRRKLYNGMIPCQVYMYY